MNDKAKEKCPVDHANSIDLIFRRQEDGTSYEYCDYCKWVKVERIELNGKCKTCGLEFHDCSKRAIYCPKHSVANRHSTERSRAWKIKNAEHYQEQQRQYEIKRNII